MKSRMSWKSVLFIMSAIILFLLAPLEFFKIEKSNIDNLDIAPDFAIFLLVISLLISVAVVLAGLVALFLFFLFAKRRRLQSIVLQKRIIDVIFKSVTSLLNEDRFIRQIWTLCAGENHPSKEGFQKLLVSGREDLNKVSQEMDDIKRQLRGSKKLSLNELKTLEWQTSLCLFNLLGTRCSRKKAIELQRVISWQEFRHDIPNEILVDELCRNTPQFSKYLNLDIKMKMLFAKNVELDLDTPGVLDAILDMMFLLKEITNFNQE